MKRIAGTKHYITHANKNSTEALSMAMEICAKGPHPMGIQELVGVINNAAIALRNVCNAAASAAD